MKSFKSLIVIAALIIGVASCGPSRNANSTSSGSSSTGTGTTDSSGTGTSGNTGDSTHQR